MRKVFEALRLTFDQDRSQREIATILSLSQSTVHDYVVRFRATGLPWPLPVEIDEAVLETRLETIIALPKPSRKFHVSVFDTGLFGSTHVCRGVGDLR